MAWSAGHTTLIFGNFVVGFHCGRVDCFVAVETFVGLVAVYTMPSHQS